MESPKKRYKPNKRENVTFIDRGMRLNKFIAHSGVCNRREADKLITDGRITVNGEVVNKMGMRVFRKDEVKYNNTILKAEPKVYVLINKPKDIFITKEERSKKKTVIEIVRPFLLKNEIPRKVRVELIGEMDEKSMGLVVLTNDVELIETLSKPRKSVKELYGITLNKPLSSKAFKSILSGVEIDEEVFKPKELSYVDDKDKSELGIEIHSNQSKLIKQAFRQMGYSIIKLDRVLFAGLTKKDLPRGRCRMLTEKEIRWLKAVR